MKNKVDYELTHEHIAQLLDPDSGVAVVTPTGDVKGLLKILIEDMNRFEFSPSIQTTKTGVTQNFKAFSDFPKESIWLEITQEISKNLREDVEKLGYSHLFQVPLDLHDPTVQFYPQSKPEDLYALSAHRDQSGFINLVVVMLVKGPSSFFICKDRKGTTPIDPKEIQAQPGDLTIMRAGNFGNNLSRPCHFVGRVEDPEGRVTLALRQISSDREKLKNMECFFGKKFPSVSPEKRSSI